MTMDDELAAVADRLPGFAGIYVDESGVLNVNMSRQASTAAIRSQVTDYLIRGGRASGTHASVMQRLTSTLRVREVQYSFRELLTWYRAHVIPAAGALPGITMSDIDERTNRIVIGLESAGLISAAQTYFADRDIPAHLLEFVQFDRLDPGAATSGSEETTAITASGSLDNNVRPTVGGLRIARALPGGDQAIGSLGFNLTASNSQDHFFVTCSHCTAVQGTVTQTEFGQPNPTSNIGVEVIDAPWFDNDSSANCPVGKWCKIHDAAMVRYYHTSTPELGQIAWPALNSTSYSETIYITDMATAYQGQTVHMVGRTSGRKSGQVLSVCTNYYYEHAEHGAVAKLCQVTASYTAGAGDSGGPVVALTSSSTASGMGIHWGFHTQKGTSFALFSPLDGALSDLYWTVHTYGTFDPTIVPPPPPAPAPPPPPFTVAIEPPFNPVRPNQTCQYNALISGGTAASYTWYVNGQQVGTNAPTYSHSAGSTFALSVWVTGTLSEIASDSLQISVNAGAPECAEW